MPRKKRSTKTKTKIRYRTRTIKVRGRRRGFSWKTALLGAVLVVAAKFGLRKFAPQLANPVTENAIPIAVALYKRSLLPGVLATTAADLIIDYLTPGGYINAPFVKTSVRGYEIG